ncbi:MAG: hypothetical protein V4581_17140 [Bacteroidota bacterium]
MQKQYYKYASGYVNIDSQNLYLTNSGNWQEARGLEEKSRATESSNDSRTSRMKGFVFTIFGAIGAFIFYMLNQKVLALPIFVGLAFTALQVLKYFKTEFGNRYKIPLHKIIAVTPLPHNGLKISFYNAMGIADEEVIKEVDPRGISFIAELTQLNATL